MSAAIDNGGPAFPCEIGGDPATDHHQTGNYTWQQYGVSMRDYFAAKALPVAAADELRHPTYDEPSYRGTAVRAYLYADEMLKARAS